MCHVEFSIGNSRAIGQFDFHKSQEYPAKPVAVRMHSLWLHYMTKELLRTCVRMTADVMSRFVTRNARSERGIRWQVWVIGLSKPFCGLQ
ncbi:MAG: hypothetical protein RLZZ505_1442 [Verrucomicrobiota bacterium]|jgi:hypothetical protein